MTVQVVLCEAILLHDDVQVCERVFLGPLCKRVDVCVGGSCMWVSRTLVSVGLLACLSDV